MPEIAIHSAPEQLPGTLNCFTGHEMDGESGLVYAKARFYDPEVGRFLSHDPVEGNPNNPPSLHRYLYAYQNPTVWVDPTGMSSEETQFFDEPTGMTIGLGEEVPEDWEVVFEHEGGRIVRPIRKGGAQEAPEDRPEESFWQKATQLVKEGAEKLQAAWTSWGEAGSSVDGASDSRRTTEDLESTSGGSFGGAESTRLAETTEKGIKAVKDTAVAGVEVADAVSTASGAAGAAVWVVKGGVKRLVKKGALGEALENGWRLPPRAGRMVELKKVRKAIQSTNPAIRLEGQAGRRLRDRLVSFQREIRSKGKRVGEIDLELDNAIVEVASGKGGGKFSQAQKLLNDRFINPEGKPVIIFGPKLKPGLVRQLQENGVPVARSLDELEDIVGGL